MCGSGRAVLCGPSARSFIFDMSGQLGFGLPDVRRDDLGDLLLKIILT